ncbi:hypothetical protein HHI36_011108 [Cryptolaemus montrouzieri]|uniref:DUF3752 domain-containing protein n=1 Tax=Cryptolaemus montrouzieri TaxID=559131 RepID=A0ABD2ML38_9CUCU
MNKEEKIYGPILPSKSAEETFHEVIELPDTTNPECESIDNTAYGPVLPPHLQKSKKPEVISVGPQLPPHLKQYHNPEYGSPEESSEDETYGPVLPGQEKKSKAQSALEERALELKLNQLNPGEEKITREEWMIELPTVSASKLGLGPRQFRRNAGPDMSDRSSWTDVAGNKVEKSETVDLKREVEDSELRKRDKEQEKMAKSHKREKESLLELHQKKRKLEKSEAPKERKPFNRETDLQVNKFDDAQKAAVLKKAQLLDDRFSQGKSKFL